MLPQKALKNVIEKSNEARFYRDLEHKIINFLLTGRKSFENILSFCGGSDRRLVRLLFQMENYGVIRFNRGLFELSRNQPQFSFNNRIGTKKVLRWFASIQKFKPPPDYRFDQRPITLENTVDRLVYLFSKGDLCGKRICFVGDDDLTSLVVAKYGLCKKVTVFDLDEDLLNFIRYISKKERLMVDIIKYDVRDKIIPKYKNKFDIFFTDPPVNPKGIILFLSRGIELLDKEGSQIGYASLYPTHSYPDIIAQRFLTKNNFIITDCVPTFSKYAPTPFLYRKTDKTLFKRYNGGLPKASFYETLLRFEKTENKPQKTHKSLLGLAASRAKSYPIKNPRLFWKN